MADWYANSPALGNQLLTTTSSWNFQSNPLGPHPVWVYFASVPLAGGQDRGIGDPAHRAGRVRPDRMHIFAMATGSARRRADGRLLTGSAGFSRARAPRAGAAELTILQGMVAGYLGVIRCTGHRRTLMILAPSGQNGSGRQARAATRRAVAAGFAGRSCLRRWHWPAARRRSAAPTTGRRKACPWLDQSLPVSKRVSMLLARMTLTEKISVVTGPAASRRRFPRPSQPVLPGPEPGGRACRAATG